MGAGLDVIILVTLSDPQPGFQGHYILKSRISQKRCQFTCPKGHLSEKYRHRVRVRVRVRAGVRPGLGLGLDLASNFGICTTTFRTNDSSEK